MSVVRACVCGVCAVCGEKKRKRKRGRTHMSPKGALRRWEEGTTAKGVWC